ncbi:MAG: C25 family cysteine peptidase [Leptospirillia bacterium]
MRSLLLLIRFLILAMPLWVAPAAALAQSPMVKIYIDKPGIYLVTPDDLTSAGVNLSGLDPVNFSMTHRGNEVAIRMFGEADGRFDASDVMLFYASGIVRDDPLFAVTDTDVYWLHLTGAAGARIEPEIPDPVDVAEPPSYQATLRVENDEVYLASTPIQVGADRWVAGDAVHAGDSALYPFSVSGFVGGPVTVRARLQGVTDDALFTGPDHHTQVTLNGCVVDEAPPWDGFVVQDHAGVVAASCLNNGDNVLVLNSLGAPVPPGESAPVDSVYLNWFEIGYNRKHMAEADELDFTGVAGPAHYRLTGMSASDILVFDVTDPYHVRQLKSLNGTLGGWSFVDSVAYPPSYLVRRAGALQRPVRIETFTPSGLTDPGAGADYVIITHPQIKDGVMPLAAFRESQGLSVKVVDVTEIYDTFSYGVTDPNAIRDFLAHTADPQNGWNPVPTYVLLAGDATINFKYVFSGGSENYVPTLFYRTSDGGMAPNDSGFVTVIGDDPYPDMMIGRLPVSPATVDGTVAKIIAYETQVFTGWEQKVQIVTDQPEPLFEEMASEFSSEIPLDVGIDRIAIGDIGGAATRNAMRFNLREGRLVTNFIGHGAGYQWSKDNVLNSDDAITLGNGNRLTFLIGLNCASGYFVQPWNDASNGLSIAESFVTEPSGGAIGAWVATWVGFSTDHRKLGLNFFRVALGESERRMGTATTKAQIAALTEGVGEAQVKSFHLFGDPAGFLGPGPSAGTGGGAPPDTGDGTGGGGEGVSVAGAGGGGCAAAGRPAAWGDSVALLLLLFGAAAWRRRQRQD